MRFPDTCPLPPGATVWGYLRDSGGDRQERSVEQQQAVLAAYCERHQLVLERVFADASHPGDSAEQRAALWEMLAAVRERFDQVHDRRQLVELAVRQHRERRSQGVKVDHRAAWASAGTVQSQYELQCDQCGQTLTATSKRGLTNAQNAHRRWCEAAHSNGREAEQEAERD